ARYEITNAGTEDWNVQLKQEGLNMVKGEFYKVNFKIGSSIDRDVKLAFMGDKNAWCGGADIHLTANKLQSFSTIVDFGYEYESGTVAFQLSMGIQPSETALEPHAIEISDISVTKVEAETKADEVTEEDVTITPPASISEASVGLEDSDEETTTPPGNKSGDLDGKSDDTADDEGADEETSDSQNDSGAEETLDGSDSGSQNESGIAEDSEVEL
ncbi:MAG: hypothetical protein K2K07_13080, partial [Lachnospiraceae bacterium]|nr:hypothetical protein [Lachnospiraceae bacterium]